MNFNLANLNLPPWLIQALANLMQTAEQVFSIPRSGAAKKAWVKQTALSLLEKVNVPGIPDNIEQPIKATLIEVAIEVLWALLFAEPEPSALDRIMRRPFTRFGRL